MEWLDGHVPRGYVLGWDTCPHLLRIHYERFARTRYRRYYLDAKNGTLSRQPAKKAASTAYGANDGQATFSVTFDEDTEITGYLKLHLYVEAVETNDMDLFAIVQKLDADGNPLVAPAPPLAGTWAGTTGKLRVSLRAIDYQRSTHFLPVHTFTRNEPLSPGEIVTVDMAIWPTSMLFHVGETLRLTLSGDVLAGSAATINKGRHSLCDLRNPLNQRILDGLGSLRADRSVSEWVDDPSHLIDIEQLR